MPSMLNRFLLGLLSALLLSLSFPPFDLGFLAWFSLIPLFLAIRHAGLKDSSWVIVFTSLISLMIIFYWINIPQGVRPYHYLIFGLYLSSFYLLFGILIHFISNRTGLPWLIAAPPLWVSVEYLRSHADFMSFPWALLGHSQYANLSVLQLATATGVFGISFMVVMTNAATADWIAARRFGEEKTSGSPPKSPAFTRMAVAWIVVFMISLTGWVSMRKPPSGQTLTLAVVQGNIPQDIKWNRHYRDFIFSKYESLTRKAAGTNPRLIVWPEAATPGLVLSDTPSRERLVKLVREVGTSILVGSAEYPKFDKSLAQLRKSGNTALFFLPDGKIQGQYLKIRLLPFGEYVPYSDFFPWPEFLVPKGLKSNLAGTKQVFFEMDKAKIGTLICSEAMYPEMSRNLVKHGADFLVNISNEAWFGRSAYPYQFLSLCVFRAVENRISMVRASNTGISCFIDPQGRIYGKVRSVDQDIFIDGTSTATIVLSPKGTFYTRYGDVFAWLCLAFSIILLFRAMFSPRPGNSTK